jgi:hypothetical protein
MYVPDTVLSSKAAEAIPTTTALFTVNPYSLVDALYVATTVSQVFSTNWSDEHGLNRPQLFLISNPTVLVVEHL